MTVLDFILIVLILGWIGGYGFLNLGWVIHLLLVVAVIVLVFRLLGLRTR